MGVAHELELEGSSGGYRSSQGRQDARESLNEALQGSQAVHNSQQRATADGPSELQSSVARVKPELHLQAQLELELSSSSSCATHQLVLELRL